MWKGILFAIIACVIWGLLFIVPQFMANFSILEVAIGRYLAYGIISIIILLKSFLNGDCRYPTFVWIKALYFALISSIGYYTWVVLALRYSSPAICALILGISPITIAFYGNWKQKAVRFRRLILPSGLILIGLIMINLPYLSGNNLLSSYLLGILSSFLALLVWSWYAVANARFLRSHPEVISSDWSTLIGVSTLFWVGVLGSILLLFTNHLNFAKYSTWNADLSSFLLGSAILGVLCSWMGAFLWNKASLCLPISLAGQLMVFETIFGLCYVYALERHLPAQMEFLGIILLLIAVIYGVRLFSQPTKAV